MAKNATYPVTEIPKLEVGLIINAFKGSYGYECEIVEEREKAIKAKVRAYICYPGVTDKVGRYVGFRWIPKKALKCELVENTDMWALAPWFKIEN